MRIKGLVVVRSGIALPFRADAGTGADPGAADPADDSAGLGTLSVQFSPFNTPYEINSFWEGRFIEHTEPGSFKKTISDAKRADGTFGTKVLFDHGMDFNIGNKMLTVPDRMAEVNRDGYHGPELSGSLFDTTYNRDLAPGLRAGAYGSSFAFEVIRDSWNNEPGTSATNPDGIPERTIQEVRLHEAGPVTWPASPTATAGLRSSSLTDQWMERVATRNGGRHEDLVRCFKAFRAAIQSIPDYRPNTPTPEPQPDSCRQVDEAIAQRAAFLRQARIDLMKRGY